MGLKFINKCIILCVRHSSRVFNMSLENPYSGGITSLILQEKNILKDVKQPA